MADAADTSRGMQFARDMKEIRRSNGISIDDIHNESKIPVGLIESFEESGLFDHTMFNRVYLRSFVRTYADVVGISADLALSSLEAALEGNYQRELAVEYLGLESGPEPAVEADSDEDTIIPEPEPEPAEEPAAPPVSAAPATPVQPPAPPAQLYEPAAVADEEEAAVAPDDTDDTWTSQSPPPGSPVSHRRTESTPSRAWGYVAFAAVVLIAAVWGVMQLSDRSERPAGSEVVAAADTSLAEGDEPDQETPMPVTLGDTMHVTIASADSQLVQDIKVTVDDDVRRPYWLEAGQSRTFTPRDRIIIERELDVIDLLVEGRPYPTNRVDDQGRIVITRDIAQQFLSESR